MLNINFLVSFKSYLLKYLSVCNITNEECKSHAVTLTLIRICPISNSSYKFSYTMPYLNFITLSPSVSTERQTYITKYKDTLEYYSGDDSPKYKINFMTRHVQSQIKILHVQSVTKLILFCIHLYK